MASSSIIQNSIGKISTKMKKGSQEESDFSPSPATPGTPSYNLQSKILKKKKRFSMFTSLRRSATKTKQRLSGSSSDKEPDVNSNAPESEPEPGSPTSSIAGSPTISIATDSEPQSEKSPGPTDLKQRISSSIEDGSLLSPDDATQHQKYTVADVAEEIMHKQQVTFQEITSYQIDVTLKEGKELAIRDRSGTSDPYVKFRIGGKQVYKSHVIYKNLNPQWNEKFTISIESLEDPIILKVFDKDLTSDDAMGSASIDLQSLSPNGVNEVKAELNETGSTEYLGYLLLDVGITTKITKEQVLQKKTTSTRKKGSKTRSGAVTITLLEGRDLIPMDETGLSDPYAKFRLGNEQRFKSKAVTQSLNPKWMEQFDLYMYDDQPTTLEVIVMDKDAAKDDIMGRGSLDLSTLEAEKTHTVDLELEDGAGTVHFLLAISGTASGEAVSDLANYRFDPEERKEIVEKYGIPNSLKGIKGWDVGWLQIKVIKAINLASADIGGKSDPLCVLELVNARLQTQTIYKTLNPEWGKVFVFNVKDIHSILEVTLYDEDRNKSLEFLGKVAIPLLRIKNREKKFYTLKDKKLTHRSKGAIQLEMDFIYNDVKAAIRTFNPREQKYISQDQKFQRKILMRNISRLTKLINAIVEGTKFVNSCFEWENKTRSAVAFIAFIVITLTFELYMVPVALLVLFLKDYIIASVTSTNQIKDEDEYDDSDDEDEEEDKDNKEKKGSKSFKERWQQIQDVIAQVQKVIGDVASLGERVKNTFNWTVPWLSMLLVIVLSVVSVVLYYIPLRWLILAWGINKFTKRLRKPHYIPNNELMDFLSRVPSDVELFQYRELRPDSQVTADKKKK